MAVASGNPQSSIASPATLATPIICGTRVTRLSAASSRTVLPQPKGVSHANSQISDNSPRACRRCTSLAGAVLAQDSPKQDMKTAGTDTKNAAKIRDTPSRTDPRRLMTRPRAERRLQQIRQSAERRPPITRPQRHEDRRGQDSGRHQDRRQRCWTRHEGRREGHAHGTEKVGDKIAGKPDSAIVRFASALRPGCRVVDLRIDPCPAKPHSPPDPPAQPNTDPLRADEGSASTRAPAAIRPPLPAQSAITATRTPRGSILCCTLRASSLRRQSRITAPPDAPTHPHQPVERSQQSPAQAPPAGREGTRCPPVPPAIPSRPSESSQPLTAIPAFFAPPAPAADSLLRCIRNLAVSDNAPSSSIVLLK